MVTISKQVPPAPQTDQHQDAPRYLFFSVWNQIQYIDNIGWKLVAQQKKKIETQMQTYKTNPGLWLSSR